MLILNSLGADELGASLVARRICSEVARDLATEHALPNASRLHHITGSFGIAMFLANDKPLATLLKQADMALYSAKNLGRNKVKLFNQDMQTSVDLRMEAETALIVACGSDDLTLYYQVLVDENGNPRGAEALLRWKKPDGYIATPTDFMEVLEEQPLVGTIGRRVLEQSMRQLKRWESNKALQRLDMSINISAGHLLSDQFTKDVEELLASTGANPRRIILELTENTLIMETDRICRLLEQLTRRGLRFSLDDFGTGYSSLTHLREMPLAQLKIDKSFVEGLPHSAKCQSIVNSVVAVGKSMKLEIVAEGVETQEQYDYLKKIGCNRYQGFFFGHPVPAESFLSD
jgi:EAL domain-containing protein (putative c-di-GMP-specific phosphodiesterase class I)